MTRRFLFAAAFVCSSSLLSACSHVAPYEREQLAKPGLDVHDREAQRAQFYTHVYDAREGAMATSEHAGGGCGCN